MPTRNPAQPDEQLTRFQAQRKLGLFGPHDYVSVGIIVLAWMTLGFWQLFGTPTVVHVMAFALVNVAIMLVWLIVLIYRVLIFVLDLHADVALMPEAAARIVAGYHLGGQQQPMRDTRMQ